MVQQAITPFESYRQKPCESETMNSVLPMALRPREVKGLFKGCTARKNQKEDMIRLCGAFYSLDILQGETWETGRSGHGVCVPRQERVRTRVWEGRWRALPPAHWHSEMPASRKQLSALGALRKIVKDSGMGKTHDWGFSLAHPSGPCLPLIVFELFEYLVKRKLVLMQMIIIHRIEDCDPWRGVDDCPVDIDQLCVYLLSLSAFLVS